MPMELEKRTNTVLNVYSVFILDILTFIIL